MLADDLADRLGRQKRILLLEAGSFIYPTHVYNRLPLSEQQPGQALRLRHIRAGGWQ